MPTLSKKPAQNKPSNDSSNGAIEWPITAARVDALLDAIERTGARHRSAHPGLVNYVLARARRSGVLRTSREIGDWLERLVPSRVHDDVSARVASPLLAAGMRALAKHSEEWTQFAIAHKSGEGGGYLSLCKEDAQRAVECIDREMVALASAKAVLLGQETQ